MYFSTLWSLRLFAIDFFARGPSYMQCCRALTLAFARLSCLADVMHSVDSAISCCLFVCFSIRLSVCLSQSGITMVFVIYQIIFTGWIYSSLKFRSSAVLPVWGDTSFLTALPPPRRPKAEGPLPLWGYRGGSPTAVRLSDPALCGSCPLVTPYYCRLGDLLCFMCVYRFLCALLSLHVCFCCFRCLICLL